MTLLEYLYNLERIATDEGFDLETLGYSEDVQTEIDKVKAIAK